MIKVHLITSEIKRIWINGLDILSSSILNLYFLLKNRLCPFVPLEEVAEKFYRDNINKEWATWFGLSMWNHPAASNFAYEIVKNGHCNSYYSVCESVFEKEVLTWFENNKDNLDKFDGPKEEEITPLYLCKVYLSQHLSLFAIDKKLDGITEVNNIPSNFPELMKKVKHCSLDWKDEFLYFLMKLIGKEGNWKKEEYHYSGDHYSFKMQKEHGKIYVKACGVPNALRKTKRVLEVLT